MDFDPSLIFGDDLPHTQGLRRFCTDHKRCGHHLTCEHAQVRNESCKLAEMWDPDGQSCKNWEPRKELQSENDKFANKRAKHNPLRRSNIITTKRHIRDGEDIA